ncbi:nitrile hydratase (plasmid) [Azospirillum sp. B510]|uniref:NHLP leader peptide family RiPP precursor n=1 Tax=Azospirillum sp. (strain B510) TaxID=137722 RepID=UPI0001C4BC81|nr:NHLP leader peptide family RiPP precursor [Azospirillum sp. B510]BAI74514.1 nitrile hydratase [Azospirillum sp. B510]
MTDQTQSAPMTRRDLEAKIVARAWSDDDFKAKFLADPKAMFEEHLGTKLPETLVMTAHEETPDTIHFVIPAKPQIDLDELSDEDLEKVAGGVDAITTAAIGTALFTLVTGLAASAVTAGVFTYIGGTMAATHKGSW